MSDFEKRVDPNATIQIDKIDALELVALEGEAAAKAAESKPPPAARRTAPPPLPPMMPEASPGTGGSLPPPSVQAPAPPRSAGKNLVYGTAFLLLLAGAIAGGVFFGARVRGEPAAPVAASAAPPAPAPSAAPSSHTLNLPAVEISGP